MHLLARFANFQLHSDINNTIKIFLLSKCKFCLDFDNFEKFRIYKIALKWFNYL
jgi:hypothetical protein